LLSKIQKLKEINLNYIAQVELFGVIEIACRAVAE
jgi:hypothetical protein